jgi:hypothetical protein
MRECGGNRRARASESPFRGDRVRRERALAGGVGRADGRDVMALRYAVQPGV